MKHKYGKFFLTFASGVIVGVVGISLYELFGKPVLPKPEIVKHDLTYHFEPEYDGWAEQFNEEMNEWETASAGDWVNFEKSLEDTQPVKVMDWMKEW